MRTRTNGLPADVRDLLHRGEGLVDATTARDAGISLDRLSHLVKTKHLVRVAEGVYASTVALKEQSEWERHRLMARAFALSCRSDAYLTEWSAAALWRLPILGKPPSMPSLVRPKSLGRGATTTPHGRILVSNLPEAHRWHMGKVGVVSQEWTAASIALKAPIVDALVIADAVAREGRNLHDALQHMHRWPGAARARWVVGHADARAESPIETLGRFTCIEHGLPMPVSNAWVGADGPEFRVDGLWPYHWAACEADGAIKYDNRPDASAVVAKQNEREWRLRRIGLDFARYGWQLAAHQRAELAERFVVLLRDNPARDKPIRWWKHVPGAEPVEPEPEDWPSPKPVRIVLPAGWRHPRR